MAERVIAVDLKIGTQQSSQNVEQLNKSLQQTDQQLENIEQQAQSMTLEDKLAALNQEVKSGELNFRQLRKKLQDYQSIAMAAGRTSPIGQKALQEAAQLRDQLDGLDQEVKMLAHDALGMKAAMQLGQGVIGGMMAVKGTMAALGVENENLMKVMTQLQGLQAASMGIEQLHNLTRKESALAIKAQQVATNGAAAAQKAYNVVVGTSTGALKLFRIALAATGLGLIVIVLAELITNWETWVDRINSAIGSLDKMGKTAKTALWILIPPLMLAIELYKQFGGYVSDNDKIMGEAFKKENDRHAKRLKQIENEKRARISAADETIKGLQRQIEINENLGKSVEQETIKMLEAQAEKVRAVRDANVQMLQSHIEHYQNIAKLRGQSEEEFKKSMAAQGIFLDDLYDRAQEIIADNEKNVELSESRITKYKREQNEKRANDAKNIREKELQEQQKLIDAQLELEEQLTQLLLQNMEDGFEKQLAMLQDKHDKEKDAIIAKYGANTELIEQLEIKQASELEALYDKVNEERIKKEEQFQKELNDIRLSNMKDGADKERALLQQKHTEELQALRIKYGEETALEKELIIQQQAELQELEREIREQQNAEKVAAAEETLSQIQAAVDVMHEINDLLDELSERRKEKIASDAEENLQTLESSKQKELAREGLTARQKEKIEKDFAMQEYKIKVAAAQAQDKIAEKQFKRNKALKLVDIAINTAAGVMQALGSFPPPASFIMAGVTGALGIAQAAVVASQKFKGSAGNIQPPQFPSASSAGGGGGGGTGGGPVSGSGGSAQSNTTTDVNQLIQEEPKTIKVTLSQVELNEANDEMVQMEQVQTL